MCRAAVSTTSLTDAIIAPSEVTERCYAPILLTTTLQPLALQTKPPTILRCDRDDRRDDVDHAANSSFRFHLGQSAKAQLSTRSRIGLDQFCFWAVPRLRHLRRWRSVHRQSEWATTLIGRAVQVRSAWLILDLPSHEPGAAFYGVTVWAKWIIDRAKTYGIRFAEKATNRCPGR
jgi:hypothetical protein